jgi:hypothetical protein
MVVWMLLETEVNRQSRRVPLENFNFTYFIQSCQQIFLHFRIVHLRYSGFYWCLII